MKLVALTALLLLVGCEDYERTMYYRNHPCGYDDGQWVWHKKLHQNVLVDRVIGGGDQFWTAAGEHFPLRCEDLETPK